MCYSAQIWADYKLYVRHHGASLSIKEFYDLFWRRRQAPQKVLVPKALEEAFSPPATDTERDIKALIDETKAAEEIRFQQEMFEQKTRLVEAERKLATKPTKKAADDQRIATKKIAWSRQKLDDLHRTELVEDDFRIFPNHFAPLMVSVAGQRMIRPMRFRCRPEGWPATVDIKYPGLYNARRDNLEGFWKRQWGRQHGILVANAFYENVNKHRAEGRELRPGEEVENVVLQFKPRPTLDMLLACLWSSWQGPEGETLLSFAFITDDPPEEVAAAGHDRCVIPIKPEHVDAWLNPGGDLKAMHAILDDRERPYYEHRWLLAA